ncbi:MAG TPA: hypothetical protein PK213_02710 [Deltaproteobacteria bacterium]|nr:hypothetical protein [Deltaproteobacteria bacterium]
MNRNRSRLFRLFVLALAFVPVVPILGLGATSVPQQGPPAGPAIKPPASPLKTRIPVGTVADGQIMNVTSPTGQGMYLGTTVKIQWEWPGHENSPVDVILGEESSQPGVFREVTPLATSRAALWTNWVIPYTFPVGFYTIRVRSTGNPNNYRDYRIKVMNSTITVTSPNSNFAMAIGSTYSIWWTYQGKPGPVKIELTNTSGTPPLIIIPNTPGGELGMGRFDWTIPSTLAPASNYVVRVTSLASGTITGSSKPFSLVLPNITITRPSYGNETLPGVYIPITWTHVGNNFGNTVHVTAWAAGSEGTSLDLQCPLSQGIYDRWMPIPLDRKQSYYIRVESTQNRSIASQTMVTVLPQQSQAPNNAAQGVNPEAFGTLQNTGSPGK